MSLTIDNKTLRNLEEQVEKNKEDIAKHYEIDRVLADWGIKVIGVVATINDIPEGNYQYGDSYGLSSTSPMQYVIRTRANPNVGQDTDYWLNVGALSLVGPQGAQGIQGIQGARGERGSKWTSATSAPTATSGYNMGDQWLNTTTGDVYEFRGNTWARLGNIKGPQGVQGPIGPKGDQGIQGPTGSQGPKGDTGSSFTIAGLLNNAENLPTPTEANRHKGYAVKNADNVTYDLYVVVGEAGSLQWVNMGRVEGVEGPQGPVGPQGPAGADIQIVHITGIPSTATQGNLTQDQVNTLLAHPGNYIQFFNENFYPQDVEIGEGYIVYSHVGQIGNETKIKNINLTIATGGWVLTETKLVNETQLNAKQDTLVSGTNIKTINNQSILGSGNITIEGGGGTPSANDTYELVLSAEAIGEEKFAAFQSFIKVQDATSIQKLSLFLAAGGASINNSVLTINASYLPSDIKDKLLSHNYLKLIFSAEEDGQTMVADMGKLPTRIKQTASLFNNDTDIIVFGINMSYTQNDNGFFYLVVVNVEAAYINGDLVLSSGLTKHQIAIQ